MSSTDKSHAIIPKKADIIISTSVLTIFTTPKAFKGHFAIIQENAIASWRQILPKGQIILIGNGYKSSHYAKKYQTDYIPSVSTNKFGTPLLSDIFRRAYGVAKFDKLAYINCDIILTDDFVKAIKQIPLHQFFLTGRRRNVDIKTRIDFRAGWQERLKVLARRKLYRKGANDYFVFTPKIDFQMPDFAIGRTSWDNWLVYKAKFLKTPVIDATNIIWAIHQNHDYSHAGGYENVWHGPESSNNQRLLEDRRKLFNVKDADYILTKEGITRPKVNLTRIIRKIEVAPVLVPKITPFIYPLTSLIKLFKFIRDKAKLSK